MIATRRLAGLTLVAALSLGAGACSSDGSDGAATDTTKAGASTTATTEQAGDGGVENTVPPASEVTLPDGFPAELAPPPTVTVTDATMVAPGSFVVRGTAAGADLEAIYEGLQAQLTDAGYEVISPSFTADGKGGGYGGVSATGPDHTVSASFGPDDTTQTEDTYVVQLNVAAVEGAGG